MERNKTRIKPLSMSLLDLEFPMGHWITGSRMGKSKQSILQEERDYIPSDQSKVHSRSSNDRMTQKELDIFMQESPLQNNPGILRDRNQHSSLLIRDMSSYQISDPGLTGIEKDFRGFWTSSLKTKSIALWSARKTDCADLPMNCWKGSWKSLALNSWFTVKRIQSNQSIERQKWRKTFWPSSISLLPEITDSGQAETEEKGKKENKKRKIPEEELQTKRGKKEKKTEEVKKKKNTKSPEAQAAKMMKIQVLPTKEQKELLWKWMGTYRWTYNKILAYFNENGLKGNSNIKNIRNLFVNNYNFSEDKKNKWVTETPYDVRDEAARDLLKGYSSNFAKKKIDPSHNFVMKFKSKKNGSSDMITIHGKHAKLNEDDNTLLSFHKKFFTQKYGYLKSAEPIPEVCLTFDCKLVREKSGNWFLLCPLPLNHVYPKSIPVSKLKSCNEEKKVVSIDPGVRTFLTCYDPCGEIFEIGTHEDTKKLHDLCLKIDDLQSLRSQKDIKKKTRYNIKIREYKIRDQIKNKRSDLHRKTAKLLISNYDVILLPKFETSRMAEHTPKRKISSDTVRKMFTWSHYSFQNLLISKAREINGTQVHIVDESYTTKTCGNCGFINDDIAGKKKYKCPKCHQELERDWNAARNILLKNSNLLL